MSRAPLRELDLAALRQDLPTYGLIAGDIGTVVFVHADGAAYEVEFVTADGRTVAVETLLADQIEPVAGQRILTLGSTRPSKSRAKRSGPRLQAAHRPGAQIAEN